MKSRKRRKGRMDLQDYATVGIRILQGYIQSRPSRGSEQCVTVRVQGSDTALGWGWKPSKKQDSTRASPTFLIASNIIMV